MSYYRNYLEMSTSYVALYCWTGNYTGGSFDYTVDRGPVRKILAAQKPAINVFAVHGGGTQATMHHVKLEDPVTWCSSHCIAKFGNHSVLDVAPILYVDGHVKVKLQQAVSDEYVEHKNDYPTW